jgi:hypothetical protein
MTKRKYIMFDFGYGLVESRYPTVMGLRRECGSMERINVGYVEAISANLVARCLWWGESAKAAGRPGLNPRGMITHPEMQGPGPQWVAVPDRFVGVETPSLVRDLSGIRFPYENGSAASSQHSFTNW